VGDLRGMGVAKVQMTGRAGGEAGDGKGHRMICEFFP
jgi:hypothetical protein